MKKSEKYNSYGYLDLTAFHALKNVEREESEKQIHKNSRKITKHRKNGKKL